LSMDGGGIRGYIPSLILEHLQDESGQLILFIPSLIILAALLLAVS